MRHNSIEMKTKSFILLFIFGLFACTDKEQNYAGDIKTKPPIEMAFDKTKWQTKDGKDYLYRDKMLNDVVYNDTIRELNKNEVLELLGKPSWYRDNKNFLYYMITQKRLFSWPLHTKTMVIKLREDDTIEWIKIHK